MSRSRTRRKKGKTVVKSEASTSSASTSASSTPKTGEYFKNPIAAKHIIREFFTTANTFKTVAERVTKELTTILQRLNEEEAILTSVERELLEEANKVYGKISYVYDDLYDPQTGTFFPPAGISFEELTEAQTFNLLEGIRQAFRVDSEGELSNLAAQFWVAYNYTNPEIEESKKPVKPKILFILDVIKTLENSRLNQALSASIAALNQDLIIPVQRTPRLQLFFKELNKLKLNNEIPISISLEQPFHQPMPETIKKANETIDSLNIKITPLCRHLNAFADIIPFISNEERKKLFNHRMLVELVSIDLTNSMTTHANAQDLRRMEETAQSLSEEEKALGVILTLVSSCSLMPSEENIEFFKRQITEVNSIHSKSVQSAQEQIIITVQKILGLMKQKGGYNSEQVNTLLDGLNTLIRTFYISSWEEHISFVNAGKRESSPIFWRFDQISIIQEEWKNAFIQSLPISKEAKKNLPTSMSIAEIKRHVSAHGSKASRRAKPTGSPAPFRKMTKEQSTSGSPTAKDRAGTSGSHSSQKTDNRTDTSESNSSNAASLEAPDKTPTVSATNASSSESSSSGVSNNKDNERDVTSPEASNDKTPTVSTANASSSEPSSSGSNNEGKRRINEDEELSDSEDEFGVNQKDSEAIQKTLREQLTALYDKVPALELKTWQSNRLLSDIDNLRREITGYQLIKRKAEEHSNHLLALKEVKLNLKMLAYSVTEFIADDSSFRRDFEGYRQIVKDYIENESDSITTLPSIPAPLINDDVNARLTAINDYLSQRAEQTKSGFRSLFSYSARDYHKRRENWKDILTLLLNTSLSENEEEFTANRQALITKLDKSIKLFQKKKIGGRSERYAAHLRILRNDMVGDQDTRAIDRATLSQYTDRIRSDANLYVLQIAHKEVSKKKPSRFASAQKKSTHEHLKQTAFYRYKIEKKNHSDDEGFPSGKTFKKTERKNSK